MEEAPPVKPICHQTGKNRVFKITQAMAELSYLDAYLEASKRSQSSFRISFRSPMLSEQFKHPLDLNSESPRNSTDQNEHIFSQTHSNLRQSESWHDGYPTQANNQETKMYSPYNIDSRQAKQGDIDVVLPNGHVTSFETPSIASDHGESCLVILSLKNQWHFFCNISCPFPFLSVLHSPFQHQIMNLV